MMLQFKYKDGEIILHLPQSKLKWCNFDNFIIYSVNASILDI